MPEMKATSCDVICFHSPAGTDKRFLLFPFHNKKKMREDPSIIRFLLFFINDRQWDLLLSSSFLLVKGKGFLLMKERDKHSLISINNGMLVFLSLFITGIVNRQYMADPL